MVDTHIKNQYRQLTKRWNLPLVQFIWISYFLKDQGAKYQFKNPFKGSTVGKLVKRTIARQGIFTIIVGLNLE